MTVVTVSVAHGVTRPPEIDEVAHDRARTRYGLPPCLHIAVGARDVSSIERFVGRVERALAAGGDNKPLLVRAYDLPEVDHRLPIWTKPGAAILRQELQVWVHVDDSRYRRAYAQAFPTDNVCDLVLDHVLNRRVARLKNFSYLRIVPITRGANSSSGGLSEKWAVAYHSTPRMVAKNRADLAFIQYADLPDIVKMLDIKTGGALKDPVNEAQAWVRPCP
jgi:hypothetical protein